MPCTNSSNRKVKRVTGSFKSLVDVTDGKKRKRSVMASAEEQKQLQDIVDVLVSHDVRIMELSVEDCARMAKQGDLLADFMGLTAGKRK